MLKNVFSIILVALFLNVAQAREAFTDDSLKALLADSANRKVSGVIYTWSPRMNLSILGTVELAAIARQLQLDMTVLVDPAVTAPEIEFYKNVPELQNSYWLSSMYLYKIGITQHYPALVVYKNGKILAPLRPGYDEPARVREYLIRRLQ